MRYIHVELLSQPTIMNSSYPFGSSALIKVRKNTGTVKNGVGLNCHFQVGDRVRVKPSVAVPKYKWGSVSHGSVGTVAQIAPNGRDVTVDFPQQNNWTGTIRFSFTELLGRNTKCCD